MPEQVNRVRSRLFCCLLAGTLAGCVSLAEHQALQAKVAALTTKQADDDRTRGDEITVARQQCEYQARQISSRIECNNNRVRDFLKSCEENSDVCSAEGVANALAFMDSQPYVLMFMRATMDAQELSDTRVGQLMSLTETKNWRPSTRFLILAQPRGDSPLHHAEAIKAGEQIKIFLRNDMGIASKLQILGPKVLPCKLKAEQLAHYMRKYDRPVRGELTCKEPFIRLWVFRTDC